MAMICTYSREGIQCQDLATHVAIRDTYTTDAWPWRVLEGRASLRGELEFCARHVEIVAKLRNQTQAFYRRKDKAVRCVVCAFPIDGAVYDVPGVGGCCGECQHAARSEQMHDPEAWQKQTRARRREMMQRDVTLSRSRLLARKRAS